MPPNEDVTVVVSNHTASCICGYDIESGVPFLSFRKAGCNICPEHIKEAGKAIVEGRLMAHFRHLEQTKETDDVS